MNARYPGVWTAQFKAETPEKSKKLYKLAKAEWAADLAGFTKEHIDDALSKCKKAYPDFYPKVGSFWRYCHEAKDAEARRDAFNEEQRQKLLSGPQITPAIRDAHLARLRVFKRTKIMPELEEV